MEIQFSPLDLESIREAARETRELAERMDDMAMGLCKKLAEIGVRVAKIHYIPEAWSGNTDVTVSAEPIEGGYKVTASGRDVFFLEFGAGVTSGLGYDTSEITPPVDISIGSWSKEHDGPFWKSWQENPANAHWYYNGRAFDGIAPQMGMYHGHKEVQLMVKEVAKEVFSRG